MSKQYGKWWIELTLILVVYELTYINSKSMYYLIDGEILIDSISAIIGSLAYSMVTVQIMLNGDRKWLKITFPVFDAFLIFCGFNLTHASNLLDNPIRFYLSIIIAVFTGLITYSIGQINAKKQDTGESKANQTESNRIIEEQNLIIDELKANQIESNRIIDELRSNEIDLKGARNEIEKIANSFLPSFLQWENFIGKKKKERNGYESSIEKMANEVKSGKLITVRDYLKSVKQ